MRILMNFLSGLTGLYMLLVFLRIMLSWFSGASFGKPFELLSRITDPYLDWFRRFRLQIGFLDFSPILALSVLSLINNICNTLAHYERISIGIILAMIVSAVWAVAAFLLGFFIIVLILRLIAFFTQRNMYSGFWHIINTFSEPIIYRITSFLFRNRIVSFMNGIIISVMSLLVLRVGGGLLIHFLMRLFERFPV